MSIKQYEDLRDTVIENESLKARIAALEAENARLRTLNDAYWAECQAQRSIGGYSAIRIRDCIDATDAARREAGLETA